MINGINHITFAVSNIVCSIDFYHQVLGLKLVAKWDMGAYLVAGDIWIALNKEDTVMPAGDYTHVSFNVDKSDFDAIREKLISSDVKSFKENTSEGDSYYFLDPDGHKLEIHYSDIKSRLDWAKDIDWETFEIVEDL